MNNPWFPFYPSDFWNDEAVQLMNYRQIGMYLKILSNDWIEDSLPADWVLVARLVRASEDDKEFRQLVALIEDKYIRDEKGRMTNKKLDDIRRRAAMISRERSKAGRRGADRRWRESKDDSNCYPFATDEQVAKNGYTESESESEKKKGSASADPHQVALIEMEPRFDPNGFLIVPDTYVRKLIDDYPTLDVRLEISKASNYNNASAPSDRKKNAKRYLVNWLNRVSGWKKNDRARDARPTTASQQNAQRARELLGGNRGEA